MGFIAENRPEFSVRFSDRSDHEDFAKLEKIAYGEFAWTRTDLDRWSRCRGNIAFAAEHYATGESLGYVLVWVGSCFVEICAVTVAREYRRLGLGGAMLDRVEQEFVSSKRTIVSAFVREDNLIGQLFFRSRGFAATAFDRQGSDNTGIGEIAFQLTLSPPIGG